MRFDDRLATVLRQTATGDAIARIQYRQLIDLLGTSPIDAQGAQFDAACLRLAELSEAIPAPERARIVGDPTLRLRNPRLLASLADSEPVVASAAMAAARLDEDEWLDLIPALPVAARSFVRNRRDLGPRVEALLGRLGIADRGLPPLAEAVPLELDTPMEAEPQVADAVAEPVVEPEPEPEEAAAPPAFDPGRSAAIGAIVRRIDEFRKARKLEAAQAPLPVDGVAPRLPLGDLAEFSNAREANSFDFASDREGRIVHCDRRFAPMATGLRLAAQGAIGGVHASPSLIQAHARRLPLRGEIVRIDGAPAIAGLWQVDASPRFARTGGTFTGYTGRLRRLDEAELRSAATASHDSPDDRMRQVLHELRTPINAIQGFAEVIQQQLFGPTPHEYRALAASIASDAAHILAGFEDVERLVKLGANAVSLDPGECDLAGVIERLARQISAHTEPRDSGFTHAAPLPAGVVVAVAENEIERLVWRLLATLASACAVGERLTLDCGVDGEIARLTLALPAILAARDDEALFQSGPAAQAQALSPGMFGSGFALRLAATEARAAGGSLTRRDGTLVLELPLAGCIDRINATERKAVH